MQVLAFDEARKHVIYQDSLLTVYPLKAQADYNR